MCQTRSNDRTRLVGHAILPPKHVPHLRRCQMIHVALILVVDGHKRANVLLSRLPPIFVDCTSAGVLPAPARCPDHVVGYGPNVALPPKAPPARTREPTAAAASNPGSTPTTKTCFPLFSPPRTYTVIYAALGQSSTSSTAFDAAMFRSPG